ncbi:MAG: helix-turn-helix transcriptional regulator [Bacteroidales bacterium]|nr:helix-turn-helix transcriptional regulator [Bacteroidales bacterium]
MSWAGKKSIGKFFRSLFHKEQAPSNNVTPHAVKPLSPAQVTRVEAKLNAWVEKRGYCLPDRSVQAAASRIGTDSVKLFRYFAMQDTDFRTWRTGLRMKEAVELMKREPQTSTSAIGRRVGINDRSNFCRQFKDIYGVTPDNWRKNQK